MSWEQRNEYFCKAQTDMQMIYIEAEREVRQLKAENAKLLEQTELLVTLLRNDCDIEASWDGLRHFWSIELTEDGCLMRDRACKAEAENAKLRKLVRTMNERDVLLPCMFGCNDDCRFYGGDTCTRIASLMHELGIEAEQ